MKSTLLAHFLHPCSVLWLNDIVIRDFTEEDNELQKTRLIVSYLLIDRVTLTCLLNEDLEDL